MTQVNAVEVAVVCAGIVDKQGFALSPVGFEPTFVEFLPGKPTLLKKHYADYLIASDPSRFTVSETPEAKTAPIQSEAASKPLTFAERMKAAKAAKAKK